MEKNEISKFLETQDISSNTKIVAIIGSGASVASGLKTFRGKDGLYEGKRAEDLASRQGFTQDPTLVWTWYRERITKVLNADPNSIHIALVKLEEEGLLTSVITQNVDGLHRRAGQSNVIEIHGNILKTHCFNSCGRTSELTKAPDPIPVKCDCGSYQRPSVVWFGESLDSTNLMKVEEHLLSASIVLIIGTSGYVYPVAQFPIFAKSQGKATLIEFNTDESAFSDVVDLFVKGPAESTIPTFVDLILQAKLQ